MLICNNFSYTGANTLHYSFKEEWENSGNKKQLLWDRCEKLIKEYEDSYSLDNHHMIENFYDDLKEIMENG